MLVQLVIVILLRNCGADRAIVQWFICFCNTYRYMNIAILLMLLCERKYNVASRQHGPLFVQLFIPVVLFFCILQSLSIFRLLVSCAQDYAICECFISDMAGCDEVDVMTVEDIEDTIEPSSNPEDVPNVVPKRGAPDFWIPSPDDDQPTLRITLPDVNGVPPTDYEVMRIKIKAQKFVTVTVTITDPEDNTVFTVSLSNIHVVFGCDMLN